MREIIIACLLPWVPEPQKKIKEERKIFFLLLYFFFEALVPRVPVFLPPTTNQPPTEQATHLFTEIRVHRVSQNSLDALADCLIDSTWLISQRQSCPNFVSVAETLPNIGCQAIVSVKSIVPSFVSKKYLCSN